MARHTRSTDPRKKPSPNYRVDDESSIGEEFEEGEQDVSMEQIAGTSSARPGGSVGESPQPPPPPPTGQEFATLKDRVAGIYNMLKEKKSNGKEKVKRGTPKRVSPRKGAKRTPKKRGRSPSRSRKERKRRRTVPGSPVTEDTDDSDDEWASDSGDSEDEIPRIDFDMEARTGKAPKNSKNKTKRKLKYPRPYMYQLRDTLLDVKDRDCYDDLSYPEYVFGLVRLISTLHKKNDGVRWLLDHFLMVSEDATKFSWENVRDFTNSCFDKVDRREMTWRSGQLIRDERIKLAWISGAKPKAEPAPCHLFNTGTCDKEDGHVEGNIIMKHRCAVCWYGAGLKECTHLLQDCNKRKGIHQRQENGTSTHGNNHGGGYYKHNQFRSKGEHKGVKASSGSEKPPAKN